MEISVDPLTGSITDASRQVLGFTDAHGDEVNLRADRYGPVLAVLQDDGTILAGNRFSPPLGYVDLNGQVRRTNRYGPVIATVQPPHQSVKAALLLLRR